MGGGTRPFELCQISNCFRQKWQKQRIRFQGESSARRKVSMQHQSGDFQLVIVTEPVKNKFYGDAHVNLRAQQLLRPRKHMQLQRGRAETAAGRDGKKITVIARLAGEPHEGRVNHWNQSYQNAPHR
jgi:hypothetical protein